MKIKLLIAAAAATLLAACGNEPAPVEEPVVDFATEAQRIAKSSILIDTHVDVPFRLVAQIPLAL